MTDPKTCTQCGGDLFLIGTLGNLTHLRCRQCGWPETDETGEPQAEFARAVSLKTSKVRVMRQADMLKCPHCIMMPEHYREDGSCRCDDPDHTEMAEWEYTWNGETQRWA